MKIFINGGTGLIGSKTAARLRDGGHEVVAAAPQNGINSVTGEGLAGAVMGAQVIVDLSNSPSYDAEAVLEFFRTSTSNLIAAAKANGIKHYVILSIVGTERLPENGYFRAKLAQEDIVKSSGLPFTIVHATQFFEFLGAMLNSWTVGDKVVVPPAQIQPIAADDVADVMAEAAIAAPRNGTLEIAGPERLRIHDAIAKYMTATADTRAIEVSPNVTYFGGKLADATLVSDQEPRLGRVDFGQWFASQTRST